MLRQIYLHGNLEKQFGIDAIALDVDHPSLLVSALSCYFKDFRNEFRKNTHYQFVKVNREKKQAHVITAETWRLGLGSAEEIPHITPSTEGSGLDIAGMMGLTGFCLLRCGNNDQHRFVDGNVCYRKQAIWLC